MQTKFYPAARNNYEFGRDEKKIEFIILHWSASESLTQTDTKFADNNRLASAHYAIENTDIHQYVKDENTAFHSGQTTVDKQSIGIICVGGVNMPVSEATYQTVSLLIEELCRKYRIPIDRDHIKGHNEITKGYCPGSLDLGRIVVDAKALSPQTIMDKLRTKIEELQEQLKQEEKKSATADARIEEVRIQLDKKEKKLIEWVRYADTLENNIVKLKSSSLFSIIRARMKKRLYGR